MEAFGVLGGAQFEDAVSNDIETREAEGSACVLPDMVQSPVSSSV
jgi:hypothetical protein